MANVKIKAVLPLLRFGLPQSEGQVAEVEKKLATEIVDLGYATFCNSKDAPVTTDADTSDK